MRLDSLWTYTEEDLEFLDTSVCIHMHVVTIYKYKNIMTILIVNARQNMDYMCMKCHSHEVFSSRAREYLNRRNFYKS